ncbi:MAG: glycosyltransferase family 2 protein [Salinivirgaceae bacterium]|jgi:glycosyltransferase involved in cell wall biosynthesis
MSVSVIILTKNENLHLERCLRSLSPFAKHVFIIDCYSTDNTVELAVSLGAKVFQNPWLNYATQFQWGLDNCPITTEWVMRMDADEYVLPELALEIKEKLHTLPTGVNGIILKRQVHFMNKWIRFGGYYPVKLLRIWRHGKGTIEARWMDEHIVLHEGTSVEFKHDIVDANLNNLSWWTEKHNSYATREAIDILNKQHHFFIEKTIGATLSKTQDSRVRWLKNNIYNRIPLFVRPFFYFFYRYFILLGFLDGKKGLIWHFLQGFWYRFLVDAKIYQINFLARTTKRSVKQVIEEDFNFKFS